MRYKNLMSSSRMRVLSVSLAAVFVATATAPTSFAQQRTRRSRRPVVASPEQQAYERAYGIYSLTSTLPPQFGNLSELEIILSPRTAAHDGVGLGRGIEGVLSFDEMLARPKRTTTRGTDGRPFTLILDRESHEHHAAELTVSADALAFKTAEVKGTSYRFEGRFTNARPTKRQPYPIALEGRLTMLEREREVATAELRFTVARSD